MTAFSTISILDGLTGYELDVLAIIAEQPDRQIIYTPRRFRPETEKWYSLCMLFGKPNTEHGGLRKALRHLERCGVIVVRRHQQQVGKKIAFVAP